VAVKTLDLGEEACLKRKLVEQPNRIVRVHCGDQTIARIADGFEMPWGYVPGCADQCKVFHIIFHNLPDFIPIKVIFT
jgi:hypothetical protein